jgi:hypothetical protein
MNRLLSIGIVLLPAMVVPPQDKRSPIEVPQVLNRGLGMVIAPYTDRPPDITLVPHGPDARHGHVWVQSVGYGLLIVGEVDGRPPDFPRNKNLILERDHVEIWLAGARDPELPPIGWGNRLQEEVTLPNGADSCEDWVKKSVSENTEAMEQKCRLSPTPLMPPLSPIRAASSFSRDRIPTVFRIWSGSLTSKERDF